jgi:hypothetical protein
MQTTLRKLMVVWPLAIFLVLPAVTRADTGVQSWVQRYNGPGNGTDLARAVVVNGSNNVIVMGISDRGGFQSDYTLIGYSIGGAPLWTNRYNPAGDAISEPVAMMADGSNNMIVVGSLPGAGGYYDYLTIKYSSAGVLLWTNTYDRPGTNHDFAAAVGVDGSNNIIVTGSSVSSGSAEDFATIKYSSTGAPLWTNLYNGPGNSHDYPSAVAVDGSNNVIVTGSSVGSGSAEDFATIKYSSVGVPLWTNRYNGPGNNSDYATAVAVDGGNNVIVTGRSSGNGSSFDYATIKYSSAGLPLWTNRYNGPGNSYDYAYAVAVDGSNNVIVTGYSTGIGSSGDCATIKYSSGGVPLWTNRYNGPGNGDDQGSALAVDHSGNVFVTGRSIGSGSSSDYATIKYSSAGVPLWTNRYNGPGNGDDQASALAVDHSGNVIVTGYSTGIEGNYDFATIKYISVQSPLMTGLQLTNGTFQLRVDNVLQPGTLVIEASTNLAGWSPVFTNTAPTNVLFYTDPEAGTFSTRFYRASQFP